MKKRICLFIGFLFLIGFVYCEDNLTKEEETNVENEFVEEIVEQKLPEEKIDEQVIEKVDEEKDELPIQKENVKTQIELLILKDFESNIDKISKLSTYLSTEEKLGLYNTYKKNNSVMPFLLNAVVGFGVGSYYEGDKLGGIIGSCLDGVGLVVLIFQISEYQDDIKRWNMRLANINYNNINQTAISSVPTFDPRAAVIILIAARIYEISRPGRYVKKINKELYESLNLNSLTASFLPVLNSDGKIALAYNLNIEL